MIPVTDLKQWAYCQRIVFYERFLPGASKPTAKMREAILAQDLIESLEMRRSLRRYGWEGGERRFGVWLRDDALGLSGKLDLVLVSPVAVAVVDFKLTSGEPGENHRMQLVGYALLVESALGLPCTHAFLYRIPDDRVFPIDLTSELRDRARAAIANIRVLELTEVLPPPTPVRARCSECEFANFCADIW